MNSPAPPILVFDCLRTAFGLHILIHAALQAFLGTISYTKRIQIVRLRRETVHFSDLFSVFPEQLEGAFGNAFPITLPIGIVFTQVCLDSFGDPGI